MKNIILFAVLMLSPLAARAQTQVYTAFSSMTWSNVVITSNTPVRVDNLILGTTGYALKGRDRIVLTVPHNLPAFNCNFYAGTSTSTTQISLSTVPLNANLGAEYLAPSGSSLQVAVPLTTAFSYWCLGQSSSGTIHVDQTAPFGSLR